MCRGGRGEVPGSYTIDPRSGPPLPSPPLRSHSTRSRAGLKRTDFFTPRDVEYVYAHQRWLRWPSRVCWQGISGFGWSLSAAPVDRTRRVPPAAVGAPIGPFSAVRRRARDDLRRCAARRRGRGLVEHTKRCPPGGFADLYSHRGARESLSPGGARLSYVSARRDRTEASPTAEDVLVKVRETWLSASFDTY